MKLKDENKIKIGKVKINGMFIDDLLENSLLAKRIFEDLLILKVKYNTITDEYTYFGYSVFFKSQYVNILVPEYRISITSIYSCDDEITDPIDYKVKFYIKEY